MSNDLECQAVTPLLAEFAAGGLPADERAAVDDHLVACPECRAAAEPLVDVADAMLLLAPTAEPPAGFEASVLTRLHPGVAPQPRRRTVVLAAAAAVLLVLGAITGAALSRATDASTHLHEAALRTADNETVGAAFVHPGQPGWVLIDMTYNEDTTLPVRLIRTDGSVTDAGSLPVRDGHAILGFRSPVPVDELRAVQMLDEDGTVVCEGDLRS